MGKFDLSNKMGTVANVIRDNSDKFNACKTKADVIALCHKLFDDAGIDTEWTRVFFINLERSKSFFDALNYVYNCYQRGTGNGVIRPGRYYEESDEDNIDESMTSNEAEEFKKKLRAGKVKFKYMKKDGSEREATGTLDPSLMNLPEKKSDADVSKASDKQIKKRKLPADSVFYYDLDANGFRSFKMSNFINYL